MPFDEIAVFVRSPQRYAGLLEHAFKRAGIPAWFDRGTGRPHPAGRAFMAVLACACEKLSARRFAEYLSLAQVPRRRRRSARPAFIAPDDELLGPAAGRGDDREDEQDALWSRARSGRSRTTTRSSTAHSAPRGNGKR